MRKPLPTAIVENIRKLLADGVTHREIVSRTGVSRNVVGRISVGSYQSAERKAVKPSPPSRGKLRYYRETLPVPVRCKECGGLITFVPCLECQIEREKKAERRQ